MLISAANLKFINYSGVEACSFVLQPLAMVSAENYIELILGTTFHWFSDVLWGFRNGTLG